MHPRKGNSIMLTCLQTLHKEVRFRKTEELFLNPPIKELETAGWFQKVSFALQLYWVRGFLTTMILVYI